VNHEFFEGNASNGAFSGIYSAHKPSTGGGGGIYLRFTVPRDEVSRLINFAYGTTPSQHWTKSAFYFLITPD